MALTKITKLEIFINGNSLNQSKESRITPFRVILFLADVVKKQF